MKKLLLILLTVFPIIHLMAQNEDYNIIGSSVIKKGKIELQNGQELKFSNLYLMNDSVIFLDSGYSQNIYALQSIEKISLTKNNAGMGALLGGGIGLLAGILTASIVHPQRTTTEWIIDEINNENESQTITKEQAPIIIGGIAGGLAIGTFVGLIKNKEQTVYQKHPDVDISTDFSFLPNQNSVLSLKVTININ